jgi:DNA-binding beta-propeller fold protein YncE
MSAAAYVSLGFLALPQGEEIGALSAVAAGPKNEIYVLHRGPKPLMAFGKDGRFVRSWGAGLFEVPHGVRADSSGNVWTTDNKNNLVRKFSPEGQLLFTLDLGFKAPDDVVFTSAGDLVFADAGNARIIVSSPHGHLIRSWGGKGKADGQFAAAHGLAIDAKDRIYVADRGNNRVQVFERNGKHAASWTGFGNPFGLLVAGGGLLVSDGDVHRISHLDLSDGSVRVQWGDPQTLQLPHFMAMDARGVLYVAEVNGRRVQKFQRR